MGNPKIGWLATGVLAVAVVVVAVLVYRRYRQDLRAASERVAKGGHIIETEQHSRGRPSGIENRTKEL